MQISSFNIINIYIIALGSPLKKSFHCDFYLIYYAIETDIYKHLGGNVSFQFKIHENKY